MSVKYSDIATEKGYSPFETAVQRMIADLVDPATGLEISKRISGLIVGSFPLKPITTAACLLVAQEAKNETASK